MFVSLNQKYNCMQFIKHYDGVYVQSFSSELLWQIFKKFIINRQSLEEPQPRGHFEHFGKSFHLQKAY